MKRLFMLAAFGVAIICSSWNAAQAFDRGMTAKVVEVGVYTNNPGATYFTVDRNAACPNSPTVMWSDPTTYAADGQKSALALLLMAKAMNSDVTIYYYVDSSNYCRYQVIQLQ